MGWCGNMEMSTPKKVSKKRNCRTFQLLTTIQELLQLNIIPIINTNDAVSPPGELGARVSPIDKRFTLSKLH
jgi:hypothetical protein